MKCMKKKSTKSKKLVVLKLTNVCSALTRSILLYGIKRTMILFELNILVKIIMRSLLVLRHLNYIMNGALRWLSRI